jgi:hypothetical protein
MTVFGLMVLVFFSWARADEFVLPQVRLEKPARSQPQKTPTGVFIYDTEAHYLTTVWDDAGDNEVLFLTALEGELILKRKEAYAGGNQDAIGAQARALAIARYTKATAAELKAFHTAATQKAQGQVGGFAEPGGVLWIDPKTKELHAWNCEGCAQGSNQFNPLYMFKEGWDSKFIGKVGGEIFALWHGHPGGGFISSEPTDIPPQWGQDLFGNSSKIIMNELFAKHFTGGGVALIVNAAVSTVFAVDSTHSREKPFVATFKKSVPAGAMRREDWAVIQYGSFSHEDVSLKNSW